MKIRAAATLALPLLLVTPGTGADPKLKQEAIAGVERRAADLISLSDQIWAFAETAWGAMGRCDAQLDALRRIHLDEPFIPDELRDEARARIRRLELAPAPGSDSECRPGSRATRRGPGDASP